MLKGKGPVIYRQVKYGPIAGGGSFSVYCSLKIQVGTGY